MEFSAFERSVIELILSQPAEGMDILRKQFTTASAVRRGYTRHSFYTIISVDRTLPPARYNEELESKLHIGAIGWTQSAPHEAITFDLWLDAGYISYLEGITSDDHWPDEREITFEIPIRRKVVRRGHGRKRGRARPHLYTEWPAH
jgi:hypothetical protein